MTPPPSDSPSVLDELRRRLREARANKDRSMFVVAGSGVSIQATSRAPAASWTGLLGLGVERCKQQASSWKKRRFDAAAVEAKLATRRVSDCIAAASVIESTLRGAGGSVYSRWLEETVGELRPTDPEILRALGSLGIPVATTNYDGLLEYELGLQPMTWRTHGLVDQLMAGTFPGGGILHLHGYFNEPQSVVLGASGVLAAPSVGRWVEPGMGPLAGSSQRRDARSCSSRRGSPSTRRAALARRKWSWMSYSSMNP